ARAAAGVARRPADRNRLVEVGDEALMPAAGRLGELVDRGALAARLAPQLAVLDALLRAPVREHVGPGVEEDAVAREAVAPRAAALLVGPLHRRRHRAVAHVAVVGLVDAHAGGRRRPAPAGWRWRGAPGPARRPAPACARGAVDAGGGNRGPTPRRSAPRRRRRATHARRRGSSGARPRGLPARRTRARTRPPRV